MTGRHSLPIRELMSGYDLHMHLFYAVDTDQGFLEALCGHSVTTSRLVDPTGLNPQKCMQCLLAHGAALADEHGDSANWRSL